MRPNKLPARAILAVGAGSLIASFYIGTGDISIGATMGAKFGFKLWWTYFVLAIAGWALIDMSVRYFLRFGRTPMSAFKDVHWGFPAYMFVAIVVCTIFGSSSQWNACAMVITGFFPSMPVELSGGIAALAAFIFIFQGVYGRLERAFVGALVLLIVCFFLSAFMAEVRWGDAARGLIPQIPGEGWQSTFMANAGSMINAWLILIYPYTMMEKRWFSNKTQEKVNILHRVRIDYAWGILAAGVVALPIIAAATSIAKPFGIVPRSYMDLSILLEPLAGVWCTYLFLIGLFLAAWTAGVGWLLCGSYALMDIFNLPIKMRSKPMKASLCIFFIPSVALLFLRLDPVFQIFVFACFLAIVFPVVGLVMLYRISRTDMGYFRWDFRRPGVVLLITADIFAVLLSLYVGWGMFWGLAGDLAKLFG